MSDTEEPKKTDEKEQAKSPEETPEGELAEVADLKDLEDLDADYLPKPKLKDYISSPDAPSRYFIVLSFLFAALATFCFCLLIVQYWKHRREAQKHIETTVKTIKLETSFHESLGEFKIDWDDADMDAQLVAECSTQEACEQLKNRNIEARDLLFPVLQASSRSDVLNPNRKLYLRQQMANKLNEMKLDGSILQVDFNDLMVEPKKH